MGLPSRPRATFLLPLAALVALTGFAPAASDAPRDRAPIAGLQSSKSKPKPAKPTDAELKLHDKGARPSTGDKHDKGRQRKLQKYNDKKRQQDGWKQR
jgi:hypothetical protein